MWTEGQELEPVRHGHDTPRDSMSTGLNSFLEELHPLGLTGSHSRVLEQRPDVGTPIAADLARKPRLKVGQTNVIAPAAGVDHDGMPALVIGAIDDEQRRAGLPHFPDVTFCWRAGAQFCQESDVP